MQDTLPQSMLPSVWSDVLPPDHLRDSRTSQRDRQPRSLQMFCGKILQHHVSHPSPQIRLQTVHPNHLPTMLVLQSVPPAGHAEVHCRRKSAASVLGSVWWVRQSLRFLCECSYADILSLPDLTEVRWYFCGVWKWSVRDHRSVPRYR